MAVDRSNLGFARLSIWIVVMSHKPPESFAVLKLMNNINLIAFFPRPLRNSQRFDLGVYGVTSLRMFTAGV